MSIDVFNFEFVDYIPDKLKNGVIYISIQYTTVVHKCACGCGNEVVTPLSPVDWSLIFDGQSISLNPSIGNWSFPCKSHYWIKNNEVKWAPRWSEEQIAAGRSHDKFLSESYYNDLNNPPNSNVKPIDKDKSLWCKIKKLLS